MQEFLTRLSNTWFWVKNRLWFRPFVAAVLSVFLVLLAKIADGSVPEEYFPEIKIDSVERLLSVLSSSLLAVSTFSVAALVSAYASVSSMTTPRSFRLVVKDDRTQNTLSVYVGALIYSVIGLIAIENRYFGRSGTFTLFVISGAVFALVLAFFVRWIDSIARLGRMSNTIARAKKVSVDAIEALACDPTMGARPLESIHGQYLAIQPPTAGYVVRINLAALEKLAEQHELKVQVMVRIGEYVRHDRTLISVQTDQGHFPEELKAQDFMGKITIMQDREFDLNPLFGVHLLSEVAAMALSPGINDHGTAIQVLRVHSDVLAKWAIERRKCQPDKPLKYPRVHVASMDEAKLIRAAFDPIARDGIANIDVMLVMAKVLEDLASLQNTDFNGALIDMTHRIEERMDQVFHLQADREKLLTTLGRVRERAGL